jgi:hypothetical protein
MFRAMSVTTHAASPVVLIGVGEVGGVFAKALLRTGRPIYPVVRSSSIEVVVNAVPEPALALVTVGEKDLEDVMAELPSRWRSRSGLIQNELLPRDWNAAGLSDPTVAAVWFEKKPGSDVKVILPTPIGGPTAQILVDALNGIDIPAVAVHDQSRLEHELVKKNLYILTANITGLVVGGTVMELWNEHRAMTEKVADEVLAIQAWLVGHSLDRDLLIDEMIDAFAADPLHGATGRSAPGRLERALRFASQADIDVPTLSAVHQGL